MNGLVEELKLHGLTVLDSKYHNSEKIDHEKFKIL